MEEKMKIKDEVYAIVEYKDGRKEIVKADPDLVVNAGLNFYQQRMYSDTVAKMSYGAVGTGTSAPAAGDTAL